MSVFLSLALASAPCPVEKAEYQLRNDPAVTARFHAVLKKGDWVTGLALQVHVSSSGRTYWFLPCRGADGRTNLAWVREESALQHTQEARRDLEFFTTDADYNVNSKVPKTRDIAPEHMLLPDLPRLAWTSTTSLDRDGMPRAFFDRVACAAPPAARGPEIDFPSVP